MSDGINETFECPRCGQAFDPITEGGRCTNGDCGDRQFDDTELAGTASPVRTTGRSPALIPDGGKEAAAEADVEGDGGDGGDGGGETAAAVDAGSTDGDADEEPPGDAGDASGESPGDAGDAGGESPGDAGDADGEPVERQVEETGEVDPAEAETTMDGSGGTRPAAATDCAGDADAAGASDEPDLRCPDCGSAVAAEDNFCRQCGRDVAYLRPGGVLRSCPACEADVDPDDSYCRECGEHLAAHRPDAPATDDGDADATTDEESRAAAGGTAASDEPSLVLVVRNREIQVTDGETVGREVRSVIMDTGGDEDDAVRVHREHVRFEREDGQFHLVDLGQNPTVVDGEHLEQGDRVPVSPGDRIELSNVAKIRVEDA